MTKGDFSFILVCLVGVLISFSTNTEYLVLELTVGTAIIIACFVLLVSGFIPTFAFILALFGELKESFLKNRMVIGVVFIFLGSFSYAGYSMGSFLEITRKDLRLLLMVASICMIAWGLHLLLANRTPSQDKISPHL